MDRNQFVWLPGEQDFLNLAMLAKVKVQPGNRVIAYWYGDPKTCEGHVLKGGDAFAVISGLKKFTTNVNNLPSFLQTAEKED
jgi:hypothetical protein